MRSPFEVVARSHTPCLRGRINAGPDDPNSSQSVVTSTRAVLGEVAVASAGLAFPASSQPRAPSRHAPPRTPRGHDDSIHRYKSRRGGTSSRAVIFAVKSARDAAGVYR